MGSHKRARARAVWPRPVRALSGFAPGARTTSAGAPKRRASRDLSHDFRRREHETARRQARREAVAREGRPTVHAKVGQTRDTDAVNTRAV